MPTLMLRWLRKILIVSFALFGVLAAVLLAMIAIPPQRPPMLPSVSAGPQADIASLPQLSRVQARDGTELAFRHCPPAVAADAGVRTFDWRVLAELIPLFGFGMFWTVGIARFPARELNAFWATYWMLIYSVVGLWLGFGYLVIGLGIAALTLIGYFFIGAYFELWMAFVNGGGSILGGLWMRRS